MMLCVNVFSIILFIIWISSVNSLVSSRLPNLLVPCYNGNFSMEDKPPLTKTLLIEMLRKIELNEKSNMNLRIFTTSLLNEIIFDGVLKSETNMTDKESLLYRARGHQFHKYKLITDYFASGAGTVSFNDSLNQNEICFLHNMLSITIDRIYRGDEKTTCNYNLSKVPIPMVELELLNVKLSSCPQMKGNLVTKWGTITPGHLIYGLAALENTRTLFDTIIREMGISKNKFGSDEANSMWISTIAGDLAESLLNEASYEMNLGIHGFWNDSELPVNFYLTDYSSDLTESILLGGIDSIILGNNLRTWKKLLMTTRLSQIIDMYYSNRGISYNTSVKASNRKIIFSDILKKTNLTQQVIGAATLLKEIGNYDRLLSENDVSELATVVVDKFEDVLDDLSKSYDSIEYIDEMHPSSSLEIILILDGTIDYFTSKKIIYSLAEAIEVSIYGSKLGIINGETGNWISNITGYIFDIFNDIKHSENSWPKKLSLHHSFETVLQHYKNLLTTSCKISPQKPLGRAVVLLSNKAKPENPDLELFKAALSSLKYILPDINVVYVLDQISQELFADLPNRYLNDSFLNISDNVGMLSTSIAKKLLRIPGQTVDIYCDESNSKMEDYLTPGVDRWYEIHEEYTKRHDFEIQFIGNANGNISVCSKSFSASSKEICKKITVNNRVIIKSKDLCSEFEKCNLQFVLKVNSSTFSCAENDCRYPDQVRLDITWVKSSGTSIMANSLYYLIIVVLSLPIIPCEF